MHHKVEPDHNQVEQQAVVHHKVEPAHILELSHNLMECDTELNLAVHTLIVGELVWKAVRTLTASGPTECCLFGCLKEVESDHKLPSALEGVHTQPEP